MSSNNARSPTTNNATPITDMLGSKFASSAKENIGIILFTVVSVGMFISSFVSMANFIGSKDDWNLIKPQITKILILTLIGTFGLIVASLLYFIQDSAKTIYFILILSCMSLGLSFSALAISAISK
jgi:hypothetical protein